MLMVGRLVKSLPTLKDRVVFNHFRRWPWNTCDFTMQEIGPESTNFLLCKVLLSKHRFLLPAFHGLRSIQMLSKRHLPAVCFLRVLGRASDFMGWFDSSEQSGGTVLRGILAAAVLVWAEAGQVIPDLSFRRDTETLLFCTGEKSELPAWLASLVILTSVSSLFLRSWIMSL